MTQQPLDWTRDVSRASGARRGCATSVSLRERYRDLLVADGPLTDHSAASLLGVSLSSINGRRAEWGDKVVAIDREVQRFARGPSTSRTRWGWAS